MNIETEKIGEDSQVSSQRRWKKTMAATPSAQPRLWWRNATVQWATATAEQHLAHGQAAKHSTTPGGNAGVADMPSNRRGGGDTAAGAEKRSKNPSEVEPEQIEPQWRDRLGRQAEAMAMNGGEAAKSPLSDESAWGGGANAPHGDGGDHRSSPESSDEVTGDSQSLERGERLGLGLGRVGERGEGRPTGPGWSGLTN
jgi:hypothetical protein